MAAAKVLSVSNPALRAAASRAGRRLGPARGGSAAVGAGSNSGGSAVACGVAGECAVLGSQAPARDLASEGRDGAAEPAAVATGGDELVCLPGGM